MENIVLNLGGLIKNFNWSDALFLLIGVSIVVLLVCIVYLLLKTDEEVNEKPIVKSDSRDLASIIDNLETNYEPKPVDLSEYEREMEDTAIISYEELLERTSTNISYDDTYESNSKDVVVKKIDPTNTSTTKELVDLPHVIMMNYDSEEAFLKALKKLQENLIR